MKYKGNNFKQAVLDIKKITNSAKKRAAILAAAKKYKISADYKFMLKLLSKKNYTCGYIPRVLSVIRMGGVSKKNVFSIISICYTCNNF